MYVNFDVMNDNSSMVYFKCHFRASMDVHVASTNFVLFGEHKISDTHLHVMIAGLLLFDKENNWLPIFFYFSFFVFLLCVCLFDCIHVCLYVCLSVSFLTCILPRRALGPHTNNKTSLLHTLFEIPHFTFTYY